MTGNRRLRPLAAAVLAGLLTSLPGSVGAFGAEPAWELSVGWNRGVHSGLDRHDGVVDHRVGKVYAFKVFMANFREQDATSRWGLGFTTQLVKTISESGPDFATNYRSTSLQLAFERALVRGGFADLALGLGTGLNWRTRKNEFNAWNSCNTPFCNFPEFNWILVPSAKMIVPVVGILALTAGVEAKIFGSAADQTYPYKSGFVFSLGIELKSTGSGRPASGRRY